MAETNQQAPQTAVPAEPIEPVNPLSGKVVPKPYSTTNVQVAPENLSRPIPEAGFAPPPPQTRPDEHPFAEDLKQEAKTQAGPAPQVVRPKPVEQFSQAIGELPPKEKAEAAERAAETALRAYGTLHVWANKWLQISDRKIFRLQTKKEIDLSIPIPYENGKDIPLGTFIKEYNRQVGDTLTVDPEWRAEVKPVLTRVLAKHGHGISDEYQLAYLVMEDLAAKIGMFTAMKRQTADVMEFAKSETEKIKKGIPPQQNMAPPPQQQQPVQQPQEQPVQQQPAPPPQPMQQAAQTHMQPASQTVQQTPPQAQRNQEPVSMTPLEAQNLYTGSNHPVDTSERAQEASRLADKVHEQSQASHIPQEQRLPVIAPVTPAESGDMHIPGNVRDKYIAESQPRIAETTVTVLPTAKSPDEPIPESSENAGDFPQEIIDGKKRKPKKAPAAKKKTIKPKR